MVAVLALVVVQLRPSSCRGEWSPFRAKLYKLQHGTDIFTDMKAPQIEENHQRESCVCVCVCVCVCARLCV